MDMPLHENTSSELSVSITAGQTVVLDIKATGQSIESTLGDFEIFLVDDAGDPVAEGPVYLLNDAGEIAYTVQIDMNEGSEKKGYGKLIGIIPGKYTATLHAPKPKPLPEEPPLPPVDPPDVIKKEEPKAVKLEQAVYFANNSDKVSNAAGLEIEKVAGLLSKDEHRDVKKVYCIGFCNEIGSTVYNKHLSLKRAIAVKKNLVVKLASAFSGIQRGKPEMFTDGYGEISGKGKSALENNRRVEFWLNEKPELNIYKK